MSNTTYKITALILSTLLSQAALAYPDETTLDINGYYEGCNEIVAIYKKENDTWVKTTTKLPIQAGFYLNDTFQHYPTCSDNSCQKIETPFTVPLNEYRAVEDKLAPPNSGLIEVITGKPAYIHAYETNILTGDLKIELKYFSDSECKKPAVHTELIQK